MAATQNARPSISATPTPVIDSALKAKVCKAQERISENLHILANEPSLAFYRLQENIRKTMPLIVEKRLDADKLKMQLEGNCYDIEYAIEEMSKMEKTKEIFDNILELSKRALVLKRQINQAKKGNTPSSSVYKRLSTHATTTTATDSTQEANSKGDKIIEKPAAAAAEYP